jgi:hypothetical protein
MRFFSPMYLRVPELYSIQLGIQKRISPIRTSVAYHGLVSFVPVRVENFLIKSFDANFLGSYAPNLDMDALRGCEFRHAFNEDGEYDPVASRYETVRVATTCDMYIIGGIIFPKSVKNGDILLANSQYPLRGDQLEKATKLLQ